MNGVARGLRVAHVVLSLDYGGLERVVLALVRASRGLGQEVSVICLERRGLLAPETEVAGARIYCVEKRPGLRFGTIGRLRALFEKIAPDVVHTHQIGTLLYAGPAARRAKVSVTIHTEHGNHLKRLTSWIKRCKARFLFRHASKRADRFCCVSEDIAKDLIDAGVDASKVLVVANGIDTDVSVNVTEVAELRERFRLPDGIPVIGTVGRIAEIKRQDILLRAFAHLKSKRPDVLLLLVGDGDQRSALEALAESLGVADAVRFAGYQSHPEAYLRLMNVFALTSSSEGMPLSILEAWAAGLPVVASRVGGVPELVCHEENGLLFDFPDVEALVHALERLCASPVLAKALGEAGRREAVARFDFKRTAAQYERLYREVLGAKKGIGPCASSP